MEFSFQKLLTWSILIGVVVYILVCTVHDYIYHQQQRIIDSIEIDRYDIPPEIQIKNFGTLYTTNNIYKYQDLKQKNIHYTLQNTPQIIKHFEDQMKATFLNGGPFHALLLTSYIFPLRQMFTIPTFFYWKGNVCGDDGCYDIDVLNKGKKIQINVIQI